MMGTCATEPSIHLHDEVTPASPIHSAFRRIPRHACRKPGQFTQHQAPVRIEPLSLVKTRQHLPQGGIPKPGQFRPGEPIPRQPAPSQESQQAKTSQLVCTHPKNEQRIILDVF